MGMKILGYRGVFYANIERTVYQLLQRLSEIRGTVYLLGAHDVVVRKAASVLEKVYNGIKVVGIHHGYFSYMDEESIAKNIKANDPDLILVGMASPKKEEWIAKYRSVISAPVTIGVGGLFDVMAGNVRPAPDWIKDHGLEWLWRLAQDPKRLWKRNLIGSTSQFVWLVIKALFKQRFKPNLRV